MVWKENKGSDGEWPEHLIAEVGNIEASRAWDMNGDNILEIVPNTPPNGPLRIYYLENGGFKEHVSLKDRDTESALVILMETVAVI